MILTFRQSVVVVGTLENKARTFGSKLNLGGFTPAKTIKRNLLKSVILAHVVHRFSPAIKCSAQVFFVGRTFGTLLGLESVKARVLCLADGVVKVELGSKVPFAIVVVVATDIVE